MARDFYETTIALPEAVTGHVVALAGVKASVVPRGALDVAGSLVDIFTADTGVTKRTNPILTTSSGTVRFWADGPYEYDIVYEDTIVPARVTDRIGWNAVPAKALPTTALLPDAGITQAHLSAAVISNEVPIGAVIEWWRPSATVLPPAGFVICDGQTTLAIGQHDFPWNSAVTVPDLRNLFILGADSSKADTTGAGGVYSDLPVDAPGIRGIGGSNKVTLSATESGAAPHGHIVDDPGHYHTDQMTNGFNAAGGQIHRYATAGDMVSLFDVTDTKYTGVSVRTSAGVAASAAHNNAPRWVGLLRIMKVKR